jgi:hypothetical protein
MQLPPHPSGEGVQIGPSDMLQWRDCPQRFAFGMRRHEESGEAPESWSSANAYGSCVHLAIHLVGKGYTDDEAIQAAFEKFRQWLDPTDLTMLRHDLETYHSRDPQGVRTLVNEEDWSFPLFTHPTAGLVFFRFKLDRLFQREDAPNRLIAVDWKSGKWIMTREEVDKDLKTWMYNVGIHEVVADLYPELEDVQLEQIYDQLRGGQEPTRKSAGQRQQMKKWMIAVVTAMLEDEEMAPTFNQWCPWCSLRMDCPVVRDELTDYASSRIALLAPRNPKLKTDGTESKVLQPPALDPARFDEYVAELPKVKRARQVLKAYEETVREALKLLPQAQLAEYVSTEAPNGYRVTQRDRSKFNSDGLRIAHKEMGDDFYEVASLSAEALKRFYGDEKERIEGITCHQVKGAAFEVVEPVK